MHLDPNQPICSTLLDTLFRVALNAFPHLMIDCLPSLRCHVACMRLRCIPSVNEDPQLQRHQR